MLQSEVLERKVYYRVNWLNEIYAIEWTDRTKCLLLSEKIERNNF